MNANLLTVMQSLSDAVNGLKQEVGQSRQIASTSSQGAPDPLWGTGYTANSDAAANANALIAQQQAQQQLSQRNNTDPGTSSGAGTGTPQEDQESQAIRALTWESLGNMGGPLGSFMQNRYVAQQYQGTISSLASKVAGAGPSQPVMTINPETGELEQDTNPDGTPKVTGGSAFGNTALGGAWNAGMNRLSDLGSSGFVTGGLMAATQALDTGSTWAGIGQALGYGHRIGLFGAATGQEGSLAQAVSQGADIRAGVTDLYRQGMPLDYARQDVTAVTQMGFSDTGLSRGDNTTIASNVVAPLTQQGVSAEGAAAWADALRNSGTSVQALTTSLKGMATAAKATKETTDQFNSSLLEFAQSQVANGGTQGQAAQTGMDFTAATGMAPSVFGQLQNNQMYQGMMMGENGVLSSDIGNLSPGAQLEGVRNLMSLLGSAFKGLDKNKYETVNGVRMISSYGNQAEMAQMAQILNLPQTQTHRLYNEVTGGHFSNVENALNIIGSPSAEYGKGGMLYGILNKSKTWQGLSESEREKATRVWDGINIHGLGLHEKQINAIQDTSNIRKRANLLRTDLLVNQKNNPMNKITGSLKVYVDVSHHAKRLINVTTGKALVQMNARAGGDAANSSLNSTLGDAWSANDAGFSTHTGIDPIQEETYTPSSDN